MSISDLPISKPSVFRSAGNLVLSTDFTVICLWAAVGMCVTALALYVGFTPLLD